VLSYIVVTGTERPYDCVEATEFECVQCRAVLIKARRMRHDLGNIVNSQIGFSHLIELSQATSDLVFEVVEIDFTGTTWIDANMCAPLGAILYRISDHLNEVSLTNIAPNVHKILSKNGFLSTYGEEKSVDTYGTTIAYTRFDPKDERYFASYIEQHFQGKGMPTMSQSLEKRFRESIYEIFSNCVLHSGTERGIFSCGQFFPNKKRLDFSIVDLGVGMRRKVASYLGRDIASDEAIMWTTTDRNTTKTGNIPGGLGLKLLKEFVSLNGGRIQIVSDSGYWEYSGGQPGAARFNAEFPGTAVNIEINTSDTKSYVLSTELTSDGIF